MIIKVEAFLGVNMNKEYRVFFGFKKDPFASNIPVADILQTQEVNNVKQRFDYTVNIGGIGVVTGDVGSGKSTALRYASANLHPSEYSIYHRFSRSTHTLIN